MEIKFNPSPVPQAEPDSTVTPRSSVRRENTESLDRATSGVRSQAALEPEVRSGEVERAKALLAEGVYPPNFVLDRIAVLLSANIQS